MFFIVLVYMVCDYNQILCYKLLAVEKIKLLNKVADDFADVGFIIYVSSCIWANILATKTKQLIWLLMPFLFSIIISGLINYQAETIFIFNKQNGFWKGDFSLNFFFCIITILFALLIFLINYFVLQRLQKLKK